MNAWYQLTQVYLGKVPWNTLCVIYPIIAVITVYTWSKNNCLPWRLIDELLQMRVQHLPCVVFLPVLSLSWHSSVSVATLRPWHAVSRLPGVSHATTINICSLMSTMITVILSITPLDSHASIQSITSFKSKTSTPVIWTGVYPHMPIAITHVTGRFVTPG